ncbi:MAG: hypothetical protein MSS82_02230 [Bacteroidales bacterium]|nr:hypothetical protein [Bacteroidales bacterium]
MKKSLTISLIVLLVLAIAAGIYFFLSQRRTKIEMQEMVEQMNFEKEQLEDEFEDFALQFDGYGKDIQNDSLAELLSREQQRVQDLLEELRITKVTNARRIAELKKELATVRSVMVQYVHQIDSLSSTNKRLETENRQVREQYQAVAAKADELEKETNRLTQVVERASMMEITDFRLTPLNHRDRKTSITSKIAKLQFDCRILKNITAEPGMKTVYLRIVRPDGEVMQKRPADVFSYENADIPYSLSKEFEYAGDEVEITMYWLVEEILRLGTYNADFFIDGNLVGSYPFRIK